MAPAAPWFIPWNERCWDVHLLQPQVTVTCQGVPQPPQAKHSGATAPLGNELSPQRRHSPSTPAHSILLSPFPSSSLVFHFPGMGLHRAALSCPGGLGLAASPGHASALLPGLSKVRGGCAVLLQVRFQESWSPRARAAHPSPSKHHSLLPPVFYIPLIIAPTPSMPLPGANCSARGDAQQGGSSSGPSPSLQQAGSSQSAPSPGGYTISHSSLTRLE